MNISSLTNSITPSSAAAVGGLQPTQVSNGSDSDSTAGDSGQVRHHHGGGHMHSAVAAALQSLGLTMPTTTDASSTSSSSSSSSGSSASSSSDDGSVTASSGNVQQDMQQFMHQLFEAVKSDSSSAVAATGGSTGSADPQNGFASGLSTLIGQVASGTAPAGLQSAFSALTSALQQTGSASASSTSTSTGTGTGADASSTTSDQAALQSFLTSLQQNLGYGAASSSPVGSLLTAMV